MTRKIKKSSKPSFDFDFVNGLDEQLKRKMVDIYNINSLDIEDVFTDTQLSKIEQNPKYLYICLLIPEYDKSKRHFLIKEVHSFVSPEYFLLIDKNNSKHTKQFVNLKDSLVSGDQSSSFKLFYEMLDFLIIKAFKVIYKFMSEIHEVEENIFNFDTKQDLLKEILVIKRNLINFASTIEPIAELIYNLQTINTKFVTSDGIEFLDDSLDKIKKILNNTSNFKEQMALLTETNESLIARNTNETVKALTSVNIIVLIPTIVTSFFGMNVYFGWGGDNNSYVELLSIIVLMVVSSFAVLWYFRKKRWIQ